MSDFEDRSKRQQRPPQTRLDEIRPRLALWVASIAMLALAYHELLELPGAGDLGEGGEAYFFAPQTTSPAIVLGLTLYLAYRRLDRLSAAMRVPPSVGATSLGAVLTAIAAALCAWAHYVDAPATLVPSLSLMVLGGALALGGAAAADALLAPSLFVLLASPIPAPLFNFVIFPLQLITASSTGTLLGLAGFDVLQLGEYVHHEEQTLYVIESCAGIRATASLLIATTLYNELMNHRRRQAVLVLLAAIPISLLINQLRVLWIALLPASDLAANHFYQGIIMIVVGVVLVALASDVIERKLRSERDFARAPSTAAALPIREAHAGIRMRAATLSLVLLALAATTVATPTWTPEPVARASITEISPSLGGDWRVLGKRLDDQYLGSVALSEWVHRTYFRFDDESAPPHRPKVDVFVGSSDRLTPLQSLISTKTGIPGPGYRTIEKQSVEIPGSNIKATLRLLRNKDHSALSLHWYHGVDSIATETLRSVFALDRGPWRRPDRAITARISVTLSADPARRKIEEAELATVAQRVLLELERIGVVNEIE